MEVSLKAGNAGVVAVLAATGALSAVLLSTEPGEAGKTQPPELFQTSDRCQACHNGLTTPGGESASIGIDWRPAMMANSGRDPYWLAAVRRETLEHPTARDAIEDECSRCHLPMASVEAKAAGRRPRLFAPLAEAGLQQPTRSGRLAADGVSCSACHQISATGLGTPASFTGHYVIDTGTPSGQRAVYGPYDVDGGRTRVMQSASTMRPRESAHIQASELCASCHTLFTHALSPQGKPVGTLPEQVPYLEWKHSAYRSKQSCQSCHMPRVEEAMPIASVLGQPREQFSRHVFRGGNFFMMGILGRHGADLGVVATPQELTLAAHRTVKHLQSSAARVTVRCSPVAANRLETLVSVANLAGHKLPTAYPSRRAWLHVTVLDGRGRPIFESGALTAAGAIVGNDNDADPSRFEPHFDRITAPDQVQIYEPILAAPDGTVTTSLLTAAKYVKDNRIPPLGFDKQSASSDVAVVGRASTDRSFRGGIDEVRYSVDVTGARGPFRVKAALWYQPIGYRWANNLGVQPTAEASRFLSYYREMAGSSAVLLNQAETSASAAPN